MRSKDPLRLALSPWRIAVANMGTPVSFARFKRMRILARQNPCLK